MNLIELVTLLSKFMPSLNIRYFTFGAVGMSIWIEGRMTKDIDIVVSIDKKYLPVFAKELNKHGFRFSSFNQRKLLQGRIIRLPIGSTELDIKLCKTKHDFSALERAVNVSYKSIKLPVATPEDIILYKLQSWRLQEQADAQRLKKEFKPLELKYLNHWLKELEKETGLPLKERWKSI